MVDALVPAVEALEKNQNASLLEALKAAEEGARQGLEEAEKAKCGKESLEIPIAEDEAYAQKS